uniref:Myb/SANT-like DNA-binding domain-containing protein 4 n=1 Tax=Electrophorus electricus TaxID=8005 RepID=A0A4W4DW35_ELEEL
MKQLKRKRKSNYSVRETQTLIREIQRRRDILFSRQQNTAVNELKRRAWDEVAACVNALGEGELRTAGEVKRRYLDWRTLMKRKELRARLAHYEPCSPDNEASLGAADPTNDPAHDPGGFPKDPAGYWQDLPDPGESGESAGGIKMEDTEFGFEEEQLTSSHCFPSILPDVDGDGHGPDDFAHIDEFGVLTIGLSAGDSTSLLVVLERQRLDLEKHRLQVESERLQVEKERLLVEKKRLRQAEMERERLQLEKERLDMERERLRLLVHQSALPQQTLVDLEAEKLKLEKERLLLEKERLQFFRFESGRLQIERERLQVEKERLQLHKDGQQMTLNS